MRSRLEARWASMFDTLQWRWEYEPDLQVGYVIPDFALVNFAHPVIVECKPALTTEELILHRRVMIGKLRRWLREDVLRELQEISTHPDPPAELLSRGTYDLHRIARGSNPRGLSRRVLAVGATLHPAGDAVTLDGEHGFCVCSQGEAHVGLSRSLGEHCLLCGQPATAWAPDDAVLNAWRESQNEVQWQAT
jgi:hypothetical protein